MAIIKVPGTALRQLNSQFKKCICGSFFSSVAAWSAAALRSCLRPSCHCVLGELSHARCAADKGLLLLDSAATLLWPISNISSAVGELG